MTCPVCREPSADCVCDERVCFVNCGLPGDQCACYRRMMSRVYADLLARQEPLGSDFERAWSENVEELYEA